MTRNTRTPLVQNPSLKNTPSEDTAIFFQNPVDCDIMMHDIKNLTLCKSVIKLPDLIARQMPF